MSPKAVESVHVANLATAKRVMARRRTPRLDSIERAVADIRNARPVVVLDDADRENAGALIFGSPADAPRRPRSPRQDSHGEVDAAEGVTTGISAADRARTMRSPADPGTTAVELSRPGHLVPLRSQDGGVLFRGGHTEAAVDLTVLAGLEPVGVVCEVVSELDRPTWRVPTNCGALQTSTASH